MNAEYSAATFVGNSRRVGAVAHTPTAGALSAVPPLPIGDLSPPNRSLLIHTDVFPEAAGDERGFAGELLLPTYIVGPRGPLGESARGTAGG